MADLAQYDGTPKNHFLGLFLPVLHTLYAHVIRVRLGHKMRDRAHENELTNEKERRSRKHHYCSTAVLVKMEMTRL